MVEGVRAERARVEVMVEEVAALAGQQDEQEAAMAPAKAEGVVKEEEA